MERETSWYDEEDEPKADRQSAKRAVEAAREPMPLPTEEPAAGSEASYSREALRDHPNCVEVRARVRGRVLNATANADEAELFADHTLDAIEKMRATPVMDSLSADPDGAAIIKDEYAKLKLGTRLETALKERKRKNRADKAADKKLSDIERAKALDAPARPFDDTGETAVEWAKDCDPLNFNDRMEMRDRVNAEYAVVRRGGKTRILHHTKTAIDYLTVEDFKLALAPFGFYDGNKPVLAAADWLRWKHREVYSGVGFYPGPVLEVPDGHFNLWRGFAIRPVEGDWSRLKAHLFETVCDGKEAYFNFLLDWIANIFQEPQRKPGTCVVIKGIEGTGKSLIKRAMRRILGSAVHSVSQPKHITGNFNAHLDHNLLLVCEEAIWSGDKAAEGVLKDLITEETITVEAKGIDAISSRNYSRLLLLTNNSWAAPAGANSRRYFVLETKAEHANDQAYFKPLFEEIDNGGAEAMLDELLKRKIKSNLRFAPETAALLEQREQSLSNLERWALDAAKSGAFTKRDGESLLLSEKVKATFSTNDIRDAARHYCGNDLGFNRALGPLLLHLGVELARPRSGGKQVPSYTFPSAAQFRVKIAAHLKVTVDAAPVIEGDVQEFAIPATDPTVSPKERRTLN